MFGVSYDGLTAAMTLLHAAPGAQSDQRAGVARRSVDERRRPSLRRAARELRVRVRGVRAGRQESRTRISTSTIYDTYDWYLKLGPLSNINAKYLHGSIPYWNAIVEHPNYDAFWKSEAWVTQIKGSSVPNLNVAGFWDQEDPWGPWQIFRQRREERSGSHQLHGRRTVVSRPWHTPNATASGRSRSADTTPRASSARTSRRRSSATSCTARATKPAWKATMFQTGSNTWRTYAAGRRRCDADESLSARGRHAVVRRAGGRGTDAYREYVSDPANPVPYRAASDLADLSGRRLAALGGRRPAVRRRTVRTC